MDKYFAVEESKDLVSELIQREEDYYTVLSSSGIARVQSRNLEYYYSKLFESDDTGISFAGDGELIKMVVNEGRVLVRQLVSLISKARLNFDPIAITSDEDTLTDSRVAKALIQQTITKKNIDYLADRALETCCVTGQAYIILHWDNMAGELYVRDEDGTPFFTGEVMYDVASCQDVIFDYRCESIYDAEWFIHKKRVNRWSLVARYPKFKKQILELPAAEDTFLDGLNSQVSFSTSEDYVTLKYFYHKPSPQLPEGRIVIYCDEDTVFHSQENSYGVNPIVEIKPEALDKCGWGYPMFSTLLPLAEMMDMAFSTIATNNAALGIQSIACASNSNVSVRDVGPLTFLMYTPLAGVPNSGKPEPLNLVATAPETFKFMESLRSYMVELSGLNDAIRGQPSAQISSGKALGILSANALELSQSLQKSYIRALETLMYYTVLAYRNFATVEQTVALTGDDDTQIARKFLGSDLADIRSVVMRVSNPLSLSAAGRMVMAENMLQAGILTDPDDYLVVMETGSLKATYNDKVDEHTLIREENNAMLEGKWTDVIATDDHAKHINAHRSLLSKTAVRSNAQLSQKILEHILKHLTVAQETSPALLAVVETGRLPPPAPPAPPPQSSAPGGV